MGDLTRENTGFDAERRGPSFARKDKAEPYPTDTDVVVEVAR
jgi:hypothetical protein